MLAVLTAGACARYNGKAGPRYVLAPCPMAALICRLVRGSSFDKRQSYSHGRLKASARYPAVRITHHGNTDPGRYVLVLRVSSRGLHAFVELLVGKGK